MTQRPAEDDRRDDDDDDDWPISENVLRSLSEDIRPTPAAAVSGSRDEVTSDVRLCLAEPVGPTAETTRRLRLRRLLLCRPPRWWPENGRGTDTAAAVAESRLMQSRLMSVPSAYPANGEYYSPEAVSYVSRTVEELSAEPFTGPVNVYTYTAGTVRYDDDGGRAGECRLHGFADPRARVTVDCALLDDAVPRHLATVKMYCTLRPPPADDPGPPVLVPHHFQEFSCAALFR
ncbi:uncharacterized protein LOC126550442 [Aphis gossypii]|uniref:uncharacterized protein LOC126550442 n=1 Tax=Aphis gossypii TaxID=80765 RepID=UPI00215946EB|nr:uncharacterized protein LOC126550442 [Aphis gossypii]XP_050057978.1 uncharacterized protein LOC126550442 [Aphis gossypii]XP_050057979.1 uncharacterized protein LOC126550442 [Aphis gossypii]